MFQLVVFLRIEFEQVRFLLGGVEDCLIQLREDFQMQHFIIEVASVKLHVEDGFIEQLQLFDGELLWQQLKAYWLKVYLLTQFLQSLSGRGRKLMTALRPVQTILPWLHRHRL